MSDTIDKINLIYILGAGHSGSTLLDLILGAQQEVESVGEIINLSRYVKKNEKCTCGQNFNNCSYWIENLNKYEQFVDKNYVSNSIYKLTPSFSSRRFRDLIKLIFIPKKLWAKDEIQNYGIKNYYLFKSILENSRNKFILDSSKSWTRLLMLDSSGLFKIKVVYLFRDGRANLESVKRKANDPRREEAEYKGALIHTLQFELGHLQRLRTLKHLNNSDVKIISYKNLTSDVETSIADICDFANVEFNTNTLNPSSKDYFSNSINHNVGGNRMRFKKVYDIQHIKKWPDGLDESEKMVFKALGGNVINYYFRKIENKK